MKIMGFSENWIKWITQCISTVSYSILINGSPTHTFTTSKDLRQGDPIFPYLILLCANVLSCALTKQEHSHNLIGLKMGRASPPLAHLLSAVGSFLFFKTNEKSKVYIQATLAWYCQLLGQGINLDNSELFCSPNLSTSHKQNLANSLGVILFEQPRKYLGINFKLRGNRTGDFQDLIHKVTSKLQGWKAKLLS